MNKMDENKFKEFLHDHILQTVCEEKLTIEAVSQKLKIEPRTFNYMKSGETMLLNTSKNTFCRQSYA